MARIDAFDSARGVAVTLVVVLHATLLPTSRVDIPQPICRMALLMLISGILAQPALTRGWSYSRKRALDFAWLMAIWTPIVLLLRGGPSSLLSLPVEFIAPTSHLWYIAGLALLGMTVPLLRHMSPLLPVMLAAIAALWHMTGGRTGMHGYDQLLHFAVFFYVGLFGRDVLIALLARCGVKMAVVAAMTMMATPFVPIAHSLLTIGSALAILLVVQGVVGTSVGRALGRFGRRTPDVYLAHVPLLSVSAHLFIPTSVTGVICLSAVIIAGCLALRTLADSVGLHWLYRRPVIGPMGKAGRAHRIRARPGFGSV